MFVFQYFSLFEALTRGDKGQPRLSDVFYSLAVHTARCGKRVQDALLLDCALAVHELRA